MGSLRKIIAGMICVFVLVPTICFADEAGAEKPAYSEGDYWVFINQNRFKERRHTFLREEGGRFVFALNGSDKTFHLYFTRDIKGFLVGYPGPVLDFPLSVGKKWECNFRRKTSTGDPQHDRLFARFEVESREQVTVPAGTFSAFKISVHIEAVERDGMVTMPQKEYYWYSPDVKQLVKRIIRKGDTWELKEYTVKGK